MRADLPSGTVTFLFTDVEGSTRLLHALGAASYAKALAEHRRVIREACASQAGVEVDTQGDAFFFTFPTAPSALAAAGEMTEALAPGPIQVRIGLHTGTPLLAEEGYVGDDVHFGARVAASAHGGQVVLSSATADLVELSLTDLGEHRLKDIEGAVAIFQLGDGHFPPLKTISNTNLPRPASSFVGREAELAEVLARVRDGARLVTLTGPGGSGKTRLALEAAASIVPEYKAGVIWVGLASLRDPALVTETIAQTLGVKDGLLEHVGEREMLLLLDNLEQVIDAAPELSTLLSDCPNLTLLVTSRELLRIQGEVEYPVPPLAEPEAVSLFCERSQLDPGDEIAELCARLDSLPLALELAAARTKVLSPAQILERISQRLDLLKGGRDADPRQQTIRATIEWSYDLLSEEEQTLYRRLSVFVGGCTLEAAEEVAQADLDTLQSLVEKSLLRFSDERYWMLETVREYAAGRFEQAGEAEEIRERHAAHFCRLAKEAEGRLRSDTQLTWLDRLEAEHENLRAALQWALDEDRALTAVELAADLGPFWAKRGYVTDARRSLDLALDASKGIRSRSRSIALRFAGGLALDQNEPEVGVPLLEESAELSRDLGDRAGLSETLGDLSWWAAFVEGDAVRARCLADESLALARHLGDERLIADALNAQAGLALAQGALGEAKDYFEDELLLHRELGDRGSVARVLINLGWLELAAGDYPDAAAALEEGFSLAKDLREKDLCAKANTFLGFAMLHMAQYEHAYELLVEGLELNAELQHLRLIGEGLHGLAGAAAAAGDGTRAVHLAAAAEQLLEELRLPLLPIEVATLDRFVVPMHAELGEGVFSEAWAKGRAMSLEEAVAYALEELADA